MEWFISVLALFFVKLLDTMAYGLLAVAYNIFYAVAQLNLFGGNAAGQELYNTITSRFYNVLSIIMVFVFAYQLIMMIIDPDGKEQKASGTLVKDTLVSIIAIILMPTLFKYMAIFQNHVLENNTIGAIVLGQNGTDNDVNPGKTISLMVFMSFYHPNNTTYTTFFDENGTLLVDGSIENSTAYNNCLSESGNRTSTCKKYIEGLQNWKNDSSYGIGSITGIKDLRHWVGDTMEYMWILCTGAGLVTAWFFFAYSIALGTRAVKLGVLQLISPIPLILRVFPQTRKTYETWFGEIKKTYLELFIRVAVIFFIIALIQQVPTFIEIIFAANNSAGDGLTKCIATVCLILGMLQFAKDAPDLFKTLFSNGGNLFSGLNFSPKIRSHVESNPYAMKAIGMGTGMAGGVAGAIGKRFKESYDAGGGKYTGTSNVLKSGLAALTAVPRGIVSGARNGFKNSPTKLTGKGTMEGALGGLNAAQSSLDNRSFSDTRDNIKNALHAANDPNSGKSFGEAVRQFGHDQAATIKEWASEGHAKSKQNMDNLKSTLTGTRRDYTRATTAAQTIVDGAEGVIGTADGLKKLDERKSAIEAEVAKGNTVKGDDGKTYTRMYKTESDVRGRSTVLDTKKLTNGHQELITSDGQKYEIDKDGKVLSKTNCIAEAVALQAKIAAANGQTISVEGKNYSGKLTDDVKTIMNNVQSVSATTIGSNGETIRQITTKSGTQYIETTATDGTKTLKSADGKVTYNFDASGIVQSKEQKVTVNGVSETRVTENVQNLIAAKQAEAATNTSETIYNVEKIYNDINDEKSSKVTKALKDNGEARKTYAKTMLTAIQDNVGSFSQSYSADKEKEFIQKFDGETIEDFLKRMSDSRTTAANIKDDDGKKFEAIKKIMNNEVKRSKANADAEKKAKEAQEAAKPKKDDKK